MISVDEYKRYKGYLEELIRRASPKGKYNEPVREAEGRYTLVDNKM